MGCKTLLERFDIKLPNSIEECNLIGLDYGDGEISAATIRIDQISNKWMVESLNLSEGAATFKNPNAFYIGAKVSKLMYHAQGISESLKTADGTQYYNFKKCPGTPEAASAFLQDDGSKSELTYEQVMSCGFQIVVRALYKSNPDLIKRNRPTIILVGRPSSPGWAQREREYARLLKDGLKVDDLTDQPVYVAVQSESLAALAREIDPKWGRSRINRKKGEVVIILDNGSSTFDITVISRDGIPEGGEDSFQFGGNLIDENLSDQMLQQAEAENIVLSARHGHKLGLRFNKEYYYGPDGTGCTESIYGANAEGDADSRGRLPKFRFPIGDDTIEYALCRMPVYVYHYEDPEGDMIQKKRIRCESWLDGCREVYRSFYKKMSRFFQTKGDAAHPVVPDRIIMSGGVSVMPEVQAVVKEVFGVQPAITERPNYAVSEGLAYVLGCEVRKANYLKNCQEAVCSTDYAPSSEILLDKIAKCGAQSSWEVYEKSIKRWAESDEDTSLKSWCENEFAKDWEEMMRYNLNTPVLNGAVRWYEDSNIEEKVSRKLQDEFKAMFPDYADDFHYSLPKINFSSLNGVTVWVNRDNAFLFGMMTGEEDKEYILSDESYECRRSKAWRQEACSKLLALSDKVRSGGSYDISYSALRVVFFREKTVQKKQTLKFAGFEESFRRDLKDKIDGIREEVLDLLKEQMKEYVEMITPYFVMTAKR